MNEFSNRKPAPKWQIILSVLIAAGVLIAAAYYKVHEPGVYVVVVFIGFFVIGLLAAVFAIGIGFVRFLKKSFPNKTTNDFESNFSQNSAKLKSAQKFDQIRDETERKKIAARNESKIFLLIKILAVPTVIVGFVLSYDLFIVTPIQDEGVVVEKTVSHGRGVSYYLHVKGREDYTKAVPRWFYNQCLLHDAVKISLTPIFKDWHIISLLRNGIVEAETTPADTYWMGFIAFGSLSSILLLFKKVRDRFGKDSNIPFKDKIVGWYLLVVMVCELITVGISIKFVCVLLGFCDSM